MGTKYKGRRNQKASGSRSFVLYSAVVIIVIVGLVMINQLSKETDDGSQRTLDEVPSIASQPVIGNTEAGVSIVEFGDYKCPSCKAWDTLIWPQLKQEYIDTGKASYSYVNVLFHGKESELAALAGESIFASNPDKFWEFHELLFANQPEQNHESAWITADSLVGMAKQIVPDLNEEAFLKDVNDDYNNPEGYAAEQVSVDYQLYNDFEVSLTPTIIINNIEIADPFNYAEIKAAIEMNIE